MDTTQDRIKQREALENVMTILLEPYVNNLLLKLTRSLHRVLMLRFLAFACVSGWLVLTLLYCFWMRYRSPIKNILTIVLLEAETGISPNAASGPLTVVKNSGFFGIYG